MKNISFRRTEGASDKVVRTNDNSAQGSFVARRHFQLEPVRGNINSRLKLTPVSYFQFEEVDAVSISKVRGNDDENLRFVKTSNRANVMLTKVQLGIYIICNANTIICTPEDKSLQNFLPDMMENDLIDLILLLRNAKHSNVIQDREQKGF